MRARQEVYVINAMGRNSPDRQTGLFYNICRGAVLFILNSGNSG